jgi:adenylate cyclase
MDRSGAWIGAWLMRLAAIGCAPDDDESTRLRKSALVLSSLSITVLATAWVVIYLALDRPASAAIPFSYQVCTVIGLGWFARHRRLRPYGVSQIMLMLILPFLLQWSLGGFENSGAVMIWAFTAPMAAMVFVSARSAWLTFAAFCLLTVASGIVDPTLASGADPLPDDVRRLFFVLDILGVGFVSFLVLIYFVLELEAERGRSEGLLRNILPGPIAERLKRGERPIADRIPAATILFVDIVDFSPLSRRLAPEQLVVLLDRVFRACDRLADRHGLEKIKTVGDAYMAAAGVPIPFPEHAEAAADMALELAGAVDAAVDGLDQPIRLRVGLHSGEVVAGVIGTRTLAYDLWGPTVNLASRMESQGVAGGIQVSDTTYRLLRDRYLFEARGPIEVKGIGRMDTWLLVGRVTPV